METRPRRRCGGHPIPLHEGQRIYYSETFRLYNNDDDEPIYFSGTDPRNASLGQPAGRRMHAIFWSPREVVVRGLAAEPWYDYTRGWSEEGYE